MPGITHFYFDGEELTVKTAPKTTQNVSQMPVLSMLTAQQTTVALSAVAVTDEMLATLKRLPIGYTRLILQPLSLTRTAIEIAKWRTGRNHCFRTSRFKGLYEQS